MTATKTAEVTIDTTAYMASRKAAPRGYAGWAFQIGDSLVFLNGKYSGSSKQAKQIAAAKGVSRITLCY